MNDKKALIIQACKFACNWNKSQSGTATGTDTSSTIARPKNFRCVSVAFFVFSRIRIGIIFEVNLF